MHLEIAILVLILMWEDGQDYTLMVDLHGVFCLCFPKLKITINRKYLWSYLEIVE